MVKFKFKVGDKVKIIKSIGCGVEQAKLSYLIITYVTGSGSYSYDAYDSDNNKISSCGGCHRDDTLQLIESINSIKNMNVLEQFELLFVDEPEKSFRKLGLTDSSDILTADGQKIFLSWLLKQNGEKFKTEVVDPIVAAQEKEKK